MGMGLIRAILGIRIGRGGRQMVTVTVMAEVVLLGGYRFVLAIGGNGGRGPRHQQSKREKKC